MADSKRKDELEKKRQKLADLRKAREERKILSSASSDASTSTTATSAAASRARQDVDELVASLVGERKPHAATATPSVDGSPPLTSGSIVHVADVSVDSITPTPTMADSEMYTGTSASKPPNLVTADFVIFEIAPKERDYYNKEVQTVTSSFEDDEVTGNEEVAPAPVDVKAKDVETSVGPEVDAAPMDKREEPSPQRELNDEEKRNIIQSEHFINFFDHSTKLIERALNEKYDILRDYTMTDDNPVDTTMGKGVKLDCSFFDERWSKNRTITDIDWSPKFSELLLCSYNKNHIAVNEADGVVLLWSLHLPERPEFVFTSQSDVMTAKFSEFHQHLIIGGTYSGQIVLWDTRAKSLPVLKTPLSAAGHTHPVYSMSIVGTLNAHSVITASTDGLVCSWALDMLAHPQEFLDLVNPSNTKTEDVAVTTLAFPSNEAASFWVGTEEGSVFQANRYDRAGSKAGINTLDLYKGHYGMITGMHFHPQNGPVDFSDLFLTSSVDWTVKLWQAKSPTKTSVTQQQISPLYSFEEADDYVYDVKWSPVHPAIFGCVDGSGRLDVYDLNQETEVPTVSVNVGNGKANNKLDWDKEGKKIAVGGSEGRCFVYDIGEISQPTSDSWAMLQKTLGSRLK